MRLRLARRGMKRPGNFSFSVCAHSERFCIRSTRVLAVKASEWRFFLFWTLENAPSEEEGMSCFLTKCPILHSGEYYHSLMPRRRIVHWRSCGVRGRLVLTLWPYIGECRKQRWDGRESRWSVKPCQWSAELGWGGGGKFL